jgi:ribosomal protein S18 acetylase RimI-like enzyme
MPPHSLAALSRIRIRAAEPADIDHLVDLEQQIFSTDRLSRKSLRHFLRSPTASVIVAEEGGRLAGVAIVLFRPRSAVARLYSIGVAPHMSGHGVAPRLLGAAEQIARARHCRTIRLEVHASNHPAISRYRKSGYREFGRYPCYYEDGGDALRFEKPIAVAPPALR